MNTELVNINDLSYEQIAAITGASTQTNVYLPRLKINKHPEDDEGRTIPTGSFFITQDGQSVYTVKGSPAVLRVYFNTYKYAKYDPNTQKFTNQSVYIKNFNEEAFDELGTLACGKIPFSKQGGLTEREKAIQKNIKCQRVVFGTVSFPKAVTVEGDTTTVANVPIQLSMAGSNFMALNDSFKLIEKMRKPYFAFPISLSLKREKNGDVVYYTIQADPALAKELTFDDGNKADFMMFNEIIERENNFVVSKWKAAKKGALSKQEERDVLADLELNDPVDDL